MKINIYSLTESFYSMLPIERGVNGPSRHSNLVMKSNQRERNCPTAKRHEIIELKGNNPDEKTGYRFFECYFKGS